MFVKKIKLDYDFSIFLNADYSVHEDTCIKYQVEEMADIYAKYGGLPKSFCYENTKINQLWWTPEQVDFKEIGRQLGMDIITISTVRQVPGCTITLHKDTFFQIKKRYPDRTEPKVRANIYLENYKFGQMIQYISPENTFETSVNWKQGDGLMWDSDVQHLSCNAGMEDKYTLQISGFKI